MHPPVPQMKAACRLDPLDKGTCGEGFELGPTPRASILRLCSLWAITALSALGGTGCNKQSTARPAFETAPVKVGAVTQVVTATGQLGAVVSVDVGSQISGRILHLHADFNSAVKKDQLVAEIEPSIYQAAVNQAKGELANACAGRELSRLTAERKRDLLEKKAGTQADFDKARAEFEQAEATVMIKDAMLEKANADLDHCRIDAPVDGIVIARKVDVGQTVAAAMTTPVLFTIAQDITKMHIVANVSEADIGGVAPGQKADFGVEAFPDEVFHGTVEQVRKSPTTTNNVVTYETVIAVDNPEQKLFPGMTAEVSIYVAERKAVLTVPNAALRFVPPAGTRFENSPAPTLSRGQRLVYCPVTNGIGLKPAIVKIGITNGTDSEVLEGLHEGDRVVTASTTPVKAAGAGPMGGPPP